MILFHFIIRDTPLSRPHTSIIVKEPENYKGASLFYNVKLYNLSFVSQFCQQFQQQTSRTHIIARTAVPPVSLPVHEKDQRQLVRVYKDPSGQHRHGFLKISLPQLMTGQLRNRFLQGGVLFLFELLQDKVKSAIPLGKGSRRFPAQESVSVPSS